MIGECTIKINGKDVSVLFGVRIFKVIQDEGLKMSESESDQMNFVNTIWAGVQNHADLIGEANTITVKDVYQLMNNDFEEFEKALKCFAGSKTMGKPVSIVAEEVKKKAKRNWWKILLHGKLSQRTV
jgi:hypothetical protein